MKKQKILCIVGPTGVGKSALGIHLAQQLQSEIISGDSIQVYKECNIGSAKVSIEEQRTIKHHLIDLLSYTEPYSVMQYQEHARTIIKDLQDQNKIPLVVGGTGLYTKALLYDYHFDRSSAAEVDDLQRYSQFTNQQLFDRLLLLDPLAAEKTHPNNRKRVMRALAIFDQSGIQKSAWIAKQSHEMLYDALLIGLTCERSRLFARINSRVDAMFAAGLENEARQLCTTPAAFTLQSMQGIGYKEFQPFIFGNASRKEVKEAIQTHSRQFAKRQYTWFLNQMPVCWFDIDEDNWQDAVMTHVKEWMQNE